jgi:hypothetical protein
MHADLISRWLGACPSFKPALDESCADFGADLPYVHAAAFAKHLLALYSAQQTTEFPAVAAFVESLHLSSDHAVREFATIGILEGIQNVWAHAGVSPDEFFPFLHPASAAAWNSLTRFWSRELPLVPDSTQPAS